MILTEEHAYHYFQEALEALDNKEPIHHAEGYFIENDTYVAFDNSTGDLWVEEFDTVQEAIDWLSDKSIEPPE